MKPFLGIDVTENDDSTVISGEEFIISRAAGVDEPADESEEIADTVEAEEGDDAVEAEEADAETEAEYEKPKKKQKEKTVHYIPLWARIIRFLCGLGGIVFFIFVMRTVMKPYGSYYLESYMQHRSWIFWAGGGAIGAWLALSVIEGIFEYRSTKKAEAEEDAAIAALGDEGLTAEWIPEDAKSVDILVFHYVTEDGKAVPVDREDAISKYINYSVSAYSDDEKLYISTLDEEYAISLDSLKSIRTEKERIAIPDWNKDTSPTQGEYKPYKLSVDNLDRITIPHYHVLEFSNNGEDWGIYFPCYELPTFEALTGLSAE